MAKSPHTFDRLDARLFRAFMAAAETENFTTAAKKAAMTQSGMSQQISKLEEQIGVALFRRVNKSVQLTETGQRLVAYVVRYLDEVDHFLSDVQLQAELIKGKVHYAMPSSCLFSPHLSMLLEKRKTHPELELNVCITPNETVMDLIISGKADFGFVTRKTKNPALSFTKFCQEEYIFVGPAGEYLKEVTQNDLREMPFVSYDGFDNALSIWLEHYFPKSRLLGSDNLNVRGSISSLTGAIKLVCGGVGATILPRHCVEQELSRKLMREIRLDAKRLPLMNQIYIAQVAGLMPTRRVQQVIDWFKEMHPGGT